MARRSARKESSGGMHALTLTAGGARGAYQAGVLKRIGEIPAFADSVSPFPIIVGASAGAINGASVAAHAENFGQGTRQIADLWSRLTASQVYRTDTAALLKNAIRAGADFGLGSFIGAGRLQALLDASPLRTLLARELPVDNIGRAVDAGHLYALAITAAGYHSGKSYTFVQGREGHPTWQKARRIALAAQISVDHVCASAAIPMVFRPVALSTGHTTAWFGDGALRLTHPLSPAIRLGADRILAIGIRCQDTARGLAEDETGYLATSSRFETKPHELPRRPPLAQICGVFLNAIFLDHLDADLDHLKRMNAFVAAYEDAVGDRPSKPDIAEPMRIVEPLMIAPSVDLAEIADSMSKRMPYMLRLMLEGLGDPDPRSADLTSYLLFDPDYSAALIDVGYQDAARRIDEIEAFLRAEQPPKASPAPPA